MGTRIRLSQVPSSELSGTSELNGAWNLEEGRGSVRLDLFFGA